MRVRLIILMLGLSLSLGLSGANTVYFSDNSTHLGRSSLESWFYIFNLKIQGNKKLLATVAFHQAGSVMLPLHYASVQWLDPSNGNSRQQTIGNPIVEEAARRALQQKAKDNPKNLAFQNKLNSFKSGNRFNLLPFKGLKGMAEISSKPFYLKFGPCRVEPHLKGYFLSCPIKDQGQLAVTLSPEKAAKKLKGDEMIDWGGLIGQGTVTKALDVAGTLNGKKIAGKAWRLHVWSEAPRQGKFTPRATIQALSLDDQPILLQWKDSGLPNQWLGPTLRDFDTPGPIVPPPSVHRWGIEKDPSQKYPLVFDGAFPPGTKPCQRIRFQTLGAKQEDTIFEGLNSRFQGFYKTSCPGIPGTGLAWVRAFGFKP